MSRLVAASLIAALLIVGCGSTGLSESEIKETIETTSLDFQYRSEHYNGDGSVVGGRATNGRATVTFEIVFGQPSIENPIFPQDKNDIDKFERAANSAGYTVTFNLPPNRRQAKLQAPVGNDIDGALCARLNSCGGPAG